MAESMLGENSATILVPCGIPWGRLQSG